jgi:predicted flap endonuclease-1-like 5' DNA nuclease
MPPPPSSRGILPGSSGAGRSAPPPPPQRSPSSSPLSGANVAASPSVVPRAPATPPPPPQRNSVPPSFSAPLTPRPSINPSAQLEQRLGAAQVELRKLGSERHTLRARLRREADRLRELESALRAEQELRRQAADEHYAVLSGLRSRLSELEAEKERERLRLSAELSRAHAALEQARADASAAAAASPKAMLGLRRIRGIGPGYQRSLEQLNITRVQQIAAWTEADVSELAEKLKIRADRIVKEDWIGQAKALPPDTED